MRSIFNTIIAVGAFCWAVFALLSLLSDLKFLVDAMDWFLGHFSVSFKDILLVIGKRISEAVSGYRELVRGLARLLHLPPIPSVVSDAAGIVLFSISRGSWLVRIKTKKIKEINLPAAGAEFEFWSGAVDKKPDDPDIWTKMAHNALESRYWRRRLSLSSIAHDLIINSIAVSLVLFLLFGIDYIYRHVVDWSIVSLFSRQ
jgi:hypothetical protein